MTAPLGEKERLSHYVLVGKLKAQRRNKHTGVLKT